MQILIPYGRLIPGLGQALEVLQSRGLSLGIVTGSRGGSLQPLEDAGLMEFFETIVTSQNVKQRKPHPDEYFIAQQSTGLFARPQCDDTGHHRPGGVMGSGPVLCHDGFTLCFLSAPTTRHSINIAAHPRVAATIQEDYKDWPEIKGIQLEGKAMKIEGTEQKAAIMRYGLKFPIIGNLAQLQPRLSGHIKLVEGGKQGSHLHLTRHHHLIGETWPARWLQSPRP